MEPKLSKLFLKLSKISASIGVVLVLVFYAPSFYYLALGGSAANSEVLSKPPGGGFEGVAEELQSEDTYQPALDKTLPEENLLQIPSVGIDTQIHEATYENYEDALRKGVWRVGDFGDPYYRNRPTILAAHRYGYLSWSIPYRLSNSFYNLPKVEVGDIITIVWKQREYKYEIVKAEKGTEITDYTADLILYTCETLNSDIRIFRYGRLIRG